MTESQLKQVIEFAHQSGQRNAGINASAKAARDYYQSLVQDGGLSIVSICGDCEGKGYIFYKNGAAWIKANCTTCNS